MLFMKTLLSEIAPAFSSKYFNMAADESFDVGLGASKHLVDSLGIDLVMHSITRGFTISLNPSANK